MTWRDIARPLILRTLQENDGKTEAEVKKALFNAYPFGERRWTPYRVWLEEVKTQRLLWAKRQRWEQGMLLKEKGHD